MKDYDRLLRGGIWCILQMEYEFIEEDKKNTQPIRIRKLTPIQMPHVDMDEVRNGRKAFIFVGNINPLPMKAMQSLFVYGHTTKDEV